jgi:hypothetical protein
MFGQPMEGFFDRGAYAEELAKVPIAEYPKDFASGIDDTQLATAGSQGHDNPDKNCNRWSLNRLDIGHIEEHSVRSMVAKLREQVFDLAHGVYGKVAGQTDGCNSTGFIDFRADRH